MEKIYFCIFLFISDIWYFFYLQVIYIRYPIICQNMRQFIWNETKRYNGLKSAVKGVIWIQDAIMNMTAKINDLKMLKLWVYFLP